MLTGQAAGEAIGVYMGLDGQRFDAARVAAAIRVSYRRRRFLRALNVPAALSGLLRPRGAARAARTASAVPSAQRRVQRASDGLARPGRPAKRTR